MNILVEVNLFFMCVGMAYLIYGYICHREGHKTKRSVLTKSKFNLTDKSKTAPDRHLKCIITIYKHYIRVSNSAVKNLICHHVIAQ